MKKITSFTIDHTILEKGIYVSRVDGDITTYDLRMRKPNTDELMTNSQIHSFEHMLATFLRNSKISDDMIYCGPMGCQTGFYVLIRNANNDIFLEILKDCLIQICEYSGEVFGNSAVECGNYKNLSLEEAQKEASAFFKVLENTQSFKYE